MTETTKQTDSPEARQRLADEGGPLFVSDWDRALFLHYEVEPAALQRAVPYELDRFEGAAYVSLVAFTIRRLRPAFGGRLTEWLSRPVATHGFLNVRTYVRHAGEPGIHFIAEWLPNRAAILLGPRLFGLPYRHGRLAYRHEHANGRLDGSVVARDVEGRLEYEAELPSGADFRPARPGSLDAFLLERYTAFMARGRRARLFRIWHRPWRQVRARARVRDRGLLRHSGDWLRHARFVGAHYAPGVRDVWIGRPHRVDGVPERGGPAVPCGHDDPPDRRRVRGRHGARPRRGVPRG